MAMRERAFSYFSRPFLAASFAEIVPMRATEPLWDDGIELLSATPEWIAIIARCDKKTADRLVQFFQEISDLPLSEKKMSQLLFERCCSTPSNMEVISIRTNMLKWRMYVHPS